MIFDEATSALDSITEEEITTTIKDISKEREQITVLIAHRLSTIMHADKIYVLERGQIVETGSHANLIDEKGYTTPCGDNRSEKEKHLLLKHKKR